MKKQMTEWVTLEGKGVILEPLTHQRHDEFVQVIEEGELHRLWYTNIPSPADLSKEIDRRLFLYERGTMLPFAVVDHRTSKAVGMTTYMNIDSHARRVEIGSTWYARSVQRTHINTEAKYLLLKYAFEELDCIAVEFRTHFLNHQSRKAIERLGAKLDGVLRSHVLSKDGSVRDTCVYSIINCEWSTVKSHLEWQMVKPR